MQSFCYRFILYSTIVYDKTSQRNDKFNVVKDLSFIDIECPLSSDFSTTHNCNNNYPYCYLTIVFPNTNTNNIKVYTLNKGVRLDFLSLKDISINCNAFFVYIKLLQTKDFLRVFQRIIFNKKET